MGLLFRAGMKQRQLVSSLVFWAQLTLKNYIRAENKLQSLSPSYSFHKSSYHKSLFSKTTAQIISTISEHKPRKAITYFGAYSYSAGTQHGNLQQLSVLMSRVTYFILQAHTGTGASRSQHRKNSGECFGAKNAGKWAASVEISKEEIPGSRRNIT